MKIRPVEAVVVLHFERQTHRHEEDKSLFEILQTRYQNRHTNTQSMHTVLLSHYIINPLTLILLMSYIYGAPILDVSRSHTTTQHSR